jgi:hypothetical protein
VADKITFVRDPAGWDHEFKSWTGVVGQYVAKKTEVVAVVARAEAPSPGDPPHGRSGFNYSTGELAAGIRTSFDHWVNRDLESQVVAIPEHALMVHEGTRPHVILPRKAPKLVFFWARKGHVVSLGGVNHPGTQPDPFLVKGLEYAFSHTRM